MISAQERFCGGIAVITGAASGIGEGLARHAASLGMKLVLADIAEEPLYRVAEQLTRITRMQILAIPTDVADAAAVERLAERAYEAILMGS